MIPKHAHRLVQVFIQYLETVYRKYEFGRIHGTWKENFNFNVLAYYKRATVHVVTTNSRLHLEAYFVILLLITTPGICCVV